MTAAVPPAVIYGAKSTADDHGSIETQQADGRALAAREGMRVAGHFKDERASAYSGDRGPDLAAAMALCEQLAAAHGGCVLVVQHSDRLARGDGVKARHLVQLLWWAQEHGVTLRSVQDDSTFSNALLTFVMGERNTEDSRRKAAAVKDGMRRRAANDGKLAGGPRPYAYRWVGEIIRVNGKERRVSHLEVVADEAEVARDIYRATVTGMSQLGIARDLNIRGIPTTRGGQWTQGSVRKVLTNPVYVGRVRHRGEVFPGEHDAIISDATWEAASRVREAAVRTKGHGGGRRPTGPHLMTRGLLRCGGCGSALIPRSSSNRREGDAHAYGYHRYICDGRRRVGLDYCAQEPLDQATLDAALLGELTRTYLDLDAMRRQIDGRIASDRARADESRADAEREAADADARYRRVMRAFQDGLIEAEDWAAQRPALIDERTAAEARLQRAEQHVATLDVAAPTLDAEAELLRHLSDLRTAIVDGIGKAPNVDATRTLLARLFRRVLYLAPGHPWLAIPGFLATQTVRLGTGYLILDLADSAVEWMDVHGGTPVSRVDHHTLDLGEQPVAEGLHR